MSASQCSLRGVGFKHPAKPGRVTIPHPNKDIPNGTAASIYRQTGWGAALKEE